MARELYMIGIVVKDMAAALAFYRRLGLAIPEDAERRTHVQVPMGGGLTFFLDANPTVWDPKFDRGQPGQPRAGSYGTILEFYLKSRAEVDQTYADLIAGGYASHAAPYETPFKMYFAMVYDPDGNIVLLSGDLGGDQPAVSEPALMDQPHAQVPHNPEVLERRIQTVGKTNFVLLCAALLSGTRDDQALARRLPDSNTDSSKRTIISTARRLVEDGHTHDVLEIILRSNLSATVLADARQLYNSLRRGADH
jgi:predicted lactoylglutathione lyase